MAPSDELAPPPALRALHLGPGDGATVRNPVGAALTFKARGSETGGAFKAVETVAAPGEAPPLHRHRDQDEVLYALEDRFRVRCGDEVREARAGTFVFVPRGVAHTWQNAGAAPARLLALAWPAALEAFFERFAQLPAGTPAAVGFRALADEAGIDVLGPPLAISHPLEDDPAAAARPAAEEA